jgi:prepilin-type N-terminal cleavage/methylation domain-containing protein
MKRMSGQQHGFTIIEVLIVLTIAMFILMLVFLAVPAANRVARNHVRKDAVEHVASEVDEYKVNHHHYPISGPTPYIDNRAAFINYLKTLPEYKNFTFRYTDDGIDHRYPFAGTGAPADPNDALDEISIIPGHICNTSSGLGPGDTDYPIRSVGSYFTDYNGYVVLTLLEGYGPGSSPTVYCVDNDFQQLYTYAPSPDLDWLQSVAKI